MGPFSPLLFSSLLFSSLLSLSLSLSLSQVLPMAHSLGRSFIHWISLSTFINNVDFHQPCRLSPTMSTLMNHVKSHQPCQVSSTMSTLINNFDLLILIQYPVTTILILRSKMSKK